MTKPEFKGASIDSDLFVGGQHLDTLSELKSKNELIGDVIALLQSPAKNVISALQSGQHIHRRISENLVRARRSRITKKIFS